MHLILIFWLIILQLKIYRLIERSQKLGKCQKIIYYLISIIINQEQNQEVLYRI